MTSASHPQRRGVTLARRALYALTGIGVLATAFELASERHWQTPAQLIPWVALAILAGATILAPLPARSARPIAMVLVVLVLGASLYGVLDHVAANHNAGPLDQRYAETWDSLPTTQQWWYAVTKTVGPAPTLAPGMLGQTALLLLVASLLSVPRNEPAI